MQSVDVQIEDSSFAELIAVSQAAGLSPAEFVRRAAAVAVRSYRARDAARRDITGYQAQPPADEEFAVDPEDLLGADDASW